MADGYLRDPQTLAINPSLAIKAECRRRILGIMSEDEQRNTLATGQAAMMEYGTDPAAWPPQLQQRQGVAMAAWVEIERLRSRSNEIEAMEPLPPDVSDAALWAVEGG
ncbi:hypothetical protein ABIB57_003622 [Devosia sp. UYZn731]|uniref:hypothetical protein n=1 Tax=Devosia sp. UYZn731 TaxID=3156345 RepID=UPI003398270E